MIYVSSACISHEKIGEVIKEFANNGINNIELSGGTDYYEELKNELIELRKMYDLKYACHAYFPPPKVPFVVNLASCNDQIYRESIDHYIQCIELLKCMECKVLSVHAGFLIEIKADEIGKKLNNRIIYNEEKAYDRFCTAYQHIAELCAKNSIDLFLENNVLSVENYKTFGMNNYMMMTDYETIVKMQRQLNFKLLLDLGHLNVSSKTLGLNFTEQCQKLKQYVKWIHLSHNDGKIDEHKPIESNSEILIEYRKMKCKDVNVTLETVGSIDEIIRSKILLERCWEECRHYV